MALSCKLFTKPRDLKLEACERSHSAHIFQGAKGEHVKKIQIALNTISVFDEDFNLVTDGIYGPLTAEAVRTYKNAPQRRILLEGQRTADAIVGIGTIKSLDREMAEIERIAPPPQPAREQTSKYVCQTATGPDGSHDHKTCPPNNPIFGSMGRCHHFGTPINPTKRGLMISLGGEGEVDYLGFKDYMPNRFGIEPTNRPIRPLTETIRPDHSVSDVCLRFAPLLKNSSEEKWKAEMRRICMPGARFTICGLDPKYYQTMLWIGPIIEKVRIPNFLDLIPKPGTYTDVYVLTMK
jgi:hypothetical protein